MTRKARHTSSHSEKDYYKRNAFYINTPNLKVWHLCERCVCCYVQEMAAKKKKRFKRRKKLLYPGLWKELFAQFRTEKKCCSKKDEETTFFLWEICFFSIELEKPRFSSELDFFSLAQICCEWFYEEKCLFFLFPLEPPLEERRDSIFFFSMT